MATQPKQFSLARSERARQRRASISNYVIEKGVVRVDEMSRLFNVSLMTIHRDLEILTNEGILRRERGVVTATATSLYESTARFRMNHNVRCKEALCELAINFVEPGQAVMMDDSTTGLALADKLPTKKPLTVISNYRAVIDRLGSHDDMTVICLGGQYYSWSDSYMGYMTERMIKSLRADVLFMSASAIIDNVCFHQGDETASIKNAMFEVSAKRILYVDHSKFDKRALHAVVPLAAFDIIIIDDCLSQEKTNNLSRLGVELYTARVHKTHQS